MYQAQSRPGATPVACRRRAPGSRRFYNPPTANNECHGTPIVNRHLAWVAALSGAIVLAGGLSACVPLAATGFVAGAAVAIDRRTAGAQIEDQSIQIRGNQRIKEVLPGDDAAYAYVHSFNRRVLLVGLAPDEAAKERAGKLMATVPNVDRVYNEIHVGATGGFGSAQDTATTAKVKAALVREEPLDSSAVRVVTEQGIVYLQGLVTENEEKVAAQAASKVSGVRKVVTLFERMSDEALAERRRQPDTGDKSLPRNN